jgi:hypothetical protein
MLVRCLSSVVLPPLPPDEEIIPVVIPCLLKRTPASISNKAKTPNSGLNFPLQINCKIDLTEGCYLALETGTDPTNSAIITESTNLLYAPCLTDNNDEECWLAIEEDGITNFEKQENFDYFLVQCI